MSAGRTCVFCGAEGKMTGEHVFPLWTRGTVLPDVRGDAGYVFGGEDGYSVVPGMPVAALQVRRVCGDCNNGWLNDLEQMAKPLLTRPIQGNPKTFHFADVQTIAVWAYKTCILADLCGTKVLGPLGFRWLYERRCPPHGVVVTMAAYGGVRFPQYALSKPVHYTVRAGAQTVELDAYLLTIGIGHLVFQVFGHHIEHVADLTPKDWKRDYCSVIWPPPASVRWPPMRTLDDEKLFTFAGSKLPDADERRRATWKHPRQD